MSQVTFNQPYTKKVIRVKNQAPIRRIKVDQTPRQWEKVIDKARKNAVHIITFPTVNPGVTVS